MQTFPTLNEPAADRAKREKAAAKQDKAHAQIDAKADRELAKFLKRCKRQSKKA